MYRVEHLTFVSNTESQFAAWLDYPWHILYSALRSMACQDWQREHLCPFCRTAHRNSGGTHDAWAYFNGCLSHLSIAPMCIGSFMLGDTLNGRGNPMTPPVIKLLKRLSPKQEAREWMPAITIIYMAPGGHRQWPMSITALLDCLSWIVLHWYRHVRWHWLLSRKQCEGIPSGNPSIKVDQRLPLHHQFPTNSLILGPRWEAIRLGNMFPKGTTLITSFIQDTSGMLFLLSIPFMLLFMTEQQNGSRMQMSGVLRKHGLSIRSTMTL